MRQEAHVVQRENPDYWQRIVDLVKANLDRQRGAREYSKLLASATQAPIGDSDRPVELVEQPCCASVGADLASELNTSINDITSGFGKQPYIANPSGARRPNPDL